MGVNLGPTSMPRRGFARGISDGFVEVGSGDVSRMLSRVWGAPQVLFGLQRDHFLFDFAPTYSSGAGWLVLNKN